MTQNEITLKACELKLGDLVYLPSNEEEGWIEEWAEVAVDVDTEIMPNGQIAIYVDIGGNGDISEVCYDPDEEVRVLRNPNETKE